MAWTIFVLIWFLKILFSLEGGWLTKSEGASLEYHNQVIIMHDSFQECWFSKFNFPLPSA